MVWADSPSPPASDLTFILFVSPVMSLQTFSTITDLKIGTGMEADVEGVMMTDVEAVGVMVVERDGSRTQSMPSCFCHSERVSGDTLNLSAVSFKELLSDASRTKDLKSSV